MAYEFVIREKDYIFTNQEPRYCREFTWVDLQALGDDIIPDFKRIIEECLLGKKIYLELGYDS